MGQKVNLPKIERRGPRITLNIPTNAVYLNVNPLEDEEEFLGFQGESTRQQITYHLPDGSCIEYDDFENVTKTWVLMSRLRMIFVESENSF
ncbi:MAG: hypothetical protein HYW24_00415 [Candidatus Aenigmarchaeota archaeon]|nr:hypothetical protein [Candidatus Aenigmarchaeota archaeon]